MLTYAGADATVGGRLTAARLEHEARALQLLCVLARGLVASVRQFVSNRGQFASAHAAGVRARAAGDADAWQVPEFTCFTSKKVGV
jgi:hypothetical protein